MSRFLISCGGTGGHLSPGISLAEGLVARGHAVTLLISQKKVDARQIEKYPHFEFLRVPGTGFAWSPLRLVRCLVTQTRGFFFCRKLVRERKPDGIVGFGGFTSAGDAVGIIGDAVYATVNPPTLGGNNHVVVVDPNALFNWPTNDNILSVM